MNRGPLHGDFGRLCVTVGPVLCDTTRIFQPVDDGPESIVRKTKKKRFMAPASPCVILCDNNKKTREGKCFLCVDGSTRGEEGHAKQWTVKMDGSVA